MSFKNISSRMWIGNIPWVEFLGKLGDKVFGIAFQSVVRVRKRIQNPPQQRHQNVIAQVVGWENHDPTTNWLQLRENLPTITLGMCSHHFIGEVVTSRGEAWLP